MFILMPVSIIRIRYCDLRLFDVRARQTRKVLK